MSAPVVIIDNGAGNCKVGFGGESAPRKIFPNCTAKPKGEKQTFVGDMILDCKETSQLSLRRPFDRGFLVNFDLEKEIWSRALKAVLRVNPRDCGLLLTEPMFNFPQLQATTEQVVFEELGFSSFYSAPAPFFSLRRTAALQPALPASQALAGVVVDAGFSSTYVVPFFDGAPIMQGVRRINVGGKVMTNYLKELVSYRSLNMQDEPYLMEVVKEAVAFVSSDTAADLKAASAPGTRSIHRREYVLPDGVNNIRGYVRMPAGPAQRAAQQPQQMQAAAAAGPAGAAAAAGPKPSASEQVLVVNNERFMVPEIMFHPPDIGLQQAGLPEVVMQAVGGCHPALAPLLLTNVVLTGGVASCPGFSPRFINELRPLVPDDIQLHVSTPPDPSLCAWEGMSLFCATGQYAQVAMTRRQYEETGGSAARLRHA